MARGGEVCNPHRVASRWPPRTLVTLLLGCSVEAEHSNLDFQGATPVLSPTDCVFDGIADPGVPGVSCGRVDVPIDWGEPEGRAIEISLMRLDPEPSVEPRGQIWLLDGGPGGSGLGLLNYGFVDQMRQSGLTVFIPSHRGTLGTEVRCSGVEAASDACRAQLQKAWGEDLRHFNVAQAADDVAYLIQLDETATVGSVSILGVSYGSLWAEYVAHRHPGVADALVLDSLLPADVDARELLEAQEASFVDLVAQCFAEPLCAEKTGFEDGATLIASMRSAVDEHSCGQLDGGTWEQSGFRAFFGRVASARRTRSFVAWLVVLVQRCTHQTSWAFDLVQGPIATHAGWGYGGVSPGNSRALGLLLLHNSVLSLDDDLELLAALDPGLVEVGVRQTLVDARRVFGDLPAIERPRPATHETPTLIISARWDLQTPPTLARRASETLTNAPRWLLDVPDGEHFVTGNARGCVLDIALKFIEDPARDPISKCSSLEASLDPALESYVHRSYLEWLLLGVEDPWSPVSP